MQSLKTEMQKKFMNTANLAQQARGDIDKMPWLPWLCVLYVHSPAHFSLCMCGKPTSPTNHLILIVVLQRRMFSLEESIVNEFMKKDKCNVFSKGDSYCVKFSICEISISIHAEEIFHCQCLRIGAFILSQ